MSNLLAKNIIDNFKAQASAAEHPRELIVDLLRAIQDQNAWVPDTGVELAAEILGLPVIEIEELATFYGRGVNVTVNGGDGSIISPNGPLAVNDIDQILSLQNTSGITGAFTTVGDNNDRIEYVGIILFKPDELVCEPCDGVRFSTAGRVLDQITFACSMILHIRWHVAYNIELMVKMTKPVV